MMRAFHASLLALVVGASAAPACELALVLAVDVSGSVDEREYDIQMQGLAAGLRDGTVVDALVDQQAMVTLIQWTGATRQRQTIPWARMLSAIDVHALADRIGGNRRVWRNYSTAIGEAVLAGETALLEVLHCRRRIIDISGDGISNEGVMPRSRHRALAERGIIVNAIAIETDDTDLTAWYFENVIFGAGAFVMTARGYEDYPEQIRRKLQRETSRQLSGLR